MNEERNEKRREHGLYDEIVTSGMAGWAKALLIIIPLAMILVWVLAG